MSRAADPVVDAASLRPRIGLEVHARLDTRTKLFCACPNEPLATPNAATCPVCAGLPGALPTLNRAAVVEANVPDRYARNSRAITLGDSRYGGASRVKTT